MDSSLRLQVSPLTIPLLASLQQHFQSQIGFFPLPDGWDSYSWPTAQKLAACPFFQRQLGQGSAGTIGLIFF